MDILYCILCVYGFISLFLTALALTRYDWVWDEVYNPIIIYKHYKVNYFGCFLLTLFFHIIFLLPAPFFWLYKLCTVGRE